MTLKPIGFVRNNVKEAPGAGYPWEEVTSEIIIDEILTDPLENLEDFSHIIVIYWMHQADRNQPLAAKVRPRGNPENPLVGRFASRAPHRPNPIGKATVRLLERRGNILKVTSLDAIDGTPVIDIKPYIPGYDSVEGATVPDWATADETDAA